MDLRVRIGDQTLRLGVDQLEDEVDGQKQTRMVYSVDNRDAVFDDVYQVFSLVRFMDTQQLPEPAEPTGDPSVTLEFYRDSDTSSVVIVRLYPYDNSFYLVESDGRTQLLVSRRDVQTLTEMFDTLRNGGTLEEAAS